jgi:RES domain
MSRYSRERIEARLRSLALESAYRIFGLSHLAEPLKIRPFPSRFCDGVSGYAVLYAAVSFETCVVETLVRDRFARRTQLELPLAAILVRACARIATKPSDTLNLLDLRGSGCLEIGAPTDAAHARHLAAGQALGRAVY